MSDYPVSRKANTVVQDLEGEVLIYDLSINKAFCLNQTAAFVYRSADGTQSIGEISNAMSIKLDMPVSEGIIYLALNELRKNDLLENADELSNHFAGLSRREAVKRVGLASMVALPIVSSIIAPTAVNAQSSCVLSNMGLPCTPSTRCCDNGLCVGIPSVCSCVCVTPGDCLTQTGCPSTANCNGGQCAP